MTIKIHRGSAAGRCDTIIRLCHKLLDRPCAILIHQYLIHSPLHHRMNCKKNRKIVSEITIIAVYFNNQK